MGVYQNIAAKCSESGISIAKAAEMSGVPYERIKKWSKHMPAADSLAKVAKALGTTSEKLLGEE